MGGTLADIYNSAHERKQLEFRRLLAQAIMQLLNERHRTKEINTLLEVYREFNKSIESVIDTKGRLKDGKNYSDIHYNFCSCKDFATRDIIKRLQREGIGVVPFDPPNNDGMKGLIIKEEDMEHFNQIVSELIVEKSGTTWMSPSAFEKTYSKRVKYSDLDEAKLDEFKNFVQGLKKNAFPYTVRHQENGKYEVCIPESVYNDVSLNVDGKIKDIHIIMSSGLLHEKQEIISQKKEKMIDKLISEANNLYGNTIEGKKIYASSINPSQFIEMEGEKLTVYTPGVKPQTFHKPFDLNELRITLYDAGRNMSMPLDNHTFNTPFIEVPKEKFHMFEGGVVSNADRNEFIENERLSSNFAVNVALFEKMENILIKNGYRKSAKQLIVNGMKENLSSSKDETSKKLLEFINNNEIKDEDIENMLKYGSCVEAGIVNDYSLAKAFDRAFENSLSVIIDYEINVENNIRNKIIDVQNKSIDVRELVDNGISQSMIDACKEDIEDLLKNKLYSETIDSIAKNLLNGIKNEIVEINEKDKYRPVQDLTGYDDMSIDDIINGEEDYGLDNFQQDRDNDQEQSM